MPLFWSPGFIAVVPELCGATGAIVVLAVDHWSQSRGCQEVRLDEGVTLVPSALPKTSPAVSYRRPTAGVAAVSAGTAGLALGRFSRGLGPVLCRGTGHGPDQKKEKRFPFSF